jgi:hypothetical protein
MRLFSIVTVIAVISMSGHVQAKQPRQGGCLRDVRLGQVICAPPNGGISKNREGQIVCGRGECVRDPYSGQVLCSSRPGGLAEWDRQNWKFVCTDSCVEASASNCQPPR